MIYPWVMPLRVAYYMGISIAAYLYRVSQKNKTKQNKTKQKQNKTNKQKNKTKQNKTTTKNLQSLDGNYILRIRKILNK